MRMTASEHMRYCETRATRCENKGENEVCPPCGAKVYEDGLRYFSRYHAESAARAFHEEVRVLEERYGVRHEDGRRWLVYNEMLGCGATDIDWKPHWELRTRADCEKGKNPLKNEGSSPCG